jgi:hypothetical protein
MASERGKAAMFLNAFMACWEIFKEKGHEPSDIIISAYRQAMDPFTPEQISQAFGRAITECKWFPKPVELIEFITGGQQGIEDRATLEGLSVIDAIKRHGVYQTVRFDDGVTNAVINEGFGGWIKLCREMTPETEKWFIKDFVTMYRVFSRNGRTYSGNLSGMIEMKNAALGFNDHIPEPFVIGYNGKKLIDNG